MDFKELIQLISKIVTNKTTYSESWAFLNLKDSESSSTLKNIKEIQKFLNANFQGIILSIKIDGQVLEDDDINMYIENNTSYTSWEININKQSFLSKNPTDISHNFFYSVDEFEKWISGLIAFSPENPLHSHINITVNNLDDNIIGKNFKIFTTKENNNLSNQLLDARIPNAKEVNKIVHSFTNEDVIINPESFIYETTSKRQSLINTFNKLACLSLSASIANEFFSKNRITLDGIKRINLTLYESTDEFSSTLYHDLLKLVKWIYEEKSITRQKLFNDRITLELDENKSFINALNKHLKSSLEQAIQRYNFVILERKDKYVSELKDLLKDIRTQSDLYSQKIRTLLNNLLRDVLAGIVLVGFTLFTKFSDNLQLNKELLLHYVFYGLAIYYIISIILQSVVDITDIQLSNKEILYWNRTTKELLPAKDFKKHIKESLYGRRCSLKVLYPLIAFLYIIIAFSCFRFPDYFDRILNGKNGIETPKNNNIKNDKIFKYKTSKDSSTLGGE